MSLDLTITNILQKYSIIRLKNDYMFPGTTNITFNPSIHQTFLFHFQSYALLTLKNCQHMVNLSFQSGCHFGFMTG